MSNILTFQAIPTAAKPSTRSENAVNTLAEAPYLGAASSRLLLPWLSDAPACCCAIVPCCASHRWSAVECPDTGPRTLSRRGGRGSLIRRGSWPSSGTCAAAGACRVSNNKFDAWCQISPAPSATRRLHCAMLPVACHHLIAGLADAHKTAGAAGSVRNANNILNWQKCGSQ